MLAVRDQGRRGTCLAFAATAVHEHSRHVRRGVVSPELSVELLFWRCKSLDGCPQDDGTSFPAVRDALSNPGQSAEALWPYDQRRDHTAAEYVPPAAALTQRELRRASLNPLPSDLKAICDALRAGHTIVGGLELWDAFYDCNTATLAPPNGDLDGAAHAVCLAGLDENRQEVKIRNSWGLSWGKNGYAWMPVTALSIVLREAWTATDDLDVT